MASHLPASLGTLNEAWDTLLRAPGAALHLVALVAVAAAWRGGGVEGRYLRTQFRTHSSSKMTGASALRAFSYLFPAGNRWCQKPWDNATAPVDRP